VVGLTDDEGVIEVVELGLGITIEEEELLRGVEDGITEELVVFPVGAGDLDADDTILDETIIDFVELETIEVELILVTDETGLTEDEDGMATGVVLGFNDDVEETTGRVEDLIEVVLVTEVVLGMTVEDAIELDTGFVTLVVLGTGVDLMIEVEVVGTAVVECTGVLASFRYRFIFQLPPQSVLASPVQGTLHPVALAFK
jgi:hypothetical protein